MGFYKSVNMLQRVILKSREKKEKEEEKVKYEAIRLSRFVKCGEAMDFPHFPPNEVDCSVSH